MNHVKLFRDWIILLLLPVMALAQSNMANTDNAELLTIDKAVSIALENHPSIRAAQANIRSASAGVTSAMSNYYPQLTSSATYTRTDGAFVFNPDNPVKDQTYNSYTGALAINQTIFDFGKTIGKVGASNSFNDAANEDFDGARQTVALDVQIAYLEMVQANQVEHVNELAVASAEQHFKQAQAFYRVGKRAQFDVTKAEVDLANANVALITARNNVRLVRLSLETAMGVHPKTPYAVADSFTITPYDTKLDSVRATTQKTRPELISARERLNASQSLVTAAKGQHLPTISAFGTWTWTNFNFPLYNKWVGGFSLTLPLFQGFAINAQVELAEAAVDEAQANLDLLNDAATTESEQYYLALRASQERVDATSKLVQQAEENLNLAEKQYTAGVNSVIEVTDAQLTLSNARITRIQALFDYNSSAIHLKRAMGTLLK